MTTSCDKKIPLILFNYINVVHSARFCERLRNVTNESKIKVK